MADAHNQAEVKTKHPEVVGTVADVAGSKKLEGNKFLATEAPEKSLVSKRDCAGL